MEERQHPNGVVTWSFDLAARAGVTAAVTTRVGGTSVGAYASCNLGGFVDDDLERVRANRDAVADALGVGRLAIARQEHGRRVVVVDSALAGTGHDPAAALPPGFDGADVLVTATPGVAVAVLAADCAPIVLVDPVRRAVGVVHAGRRGVVVDALGAGVAALGDLVGSDPAELLAGVGPCIGAGAYEIDGLALAEADEAFGGRFLQPTSPGRATFDLRSAVVARLHEAGVARDRVELADATTDSRPDRFFSDRAARPCGRFGVVAALP